MFVEIEDHLFKRNFILTLKLNVKVNYLTFLPHTHTHTHLHTQKTKYKIYP